ncbi:MAG: 30S ribosomal protein S18 [Candidatus Omnitrophica bacterium]|nr:30S ribosomal protein S18 [Candidatus Omnitrophota bacterium]
MRPKKKLIKYNLAKGEETKIDYKNFPLLQRYITDRGKIVSRRISGITAKQQRDLAAAVKQARYLGLLSVGSAKRRF